MEWLQQLNQAIEYIEDNLAGDISYDKAAQIACCSTHQFQRMFSYIAGISLSEYIRHRRMSAAAFDLQGKNAKVSEIAAKYGYQSPTAFNRAFQSIHGVPPSAVWTTF
ncbi:MAG: helix-turn-helix transcriptional regulator [Peptococcaceae bacterium]|nr:helix-turn-helix transcriptional regulator [Peptococcaceae bacterium]